LYSFTLQTQEDLTGFTSQLEVPFLSHLNFSHEKAKPKSDYFIWLFGFIIF